MEQTAVDATIVIATHNRAERLRDALASLRAQTLDRERFEIVVVDDGSTDATARVVASAVAEGGPSVRCIRRASSAGPALARNEGWRAASAPLIAFIDDDCVAEPGWLESGIASWGGHDDVFVQGATTPIQEELDRLGFFSYTYDVTEMAPEFSTCNMFYPRALLERLGGFDVASFPHQGEDADLAWRARSIGARPVFAPGAHARHAVVELGPLGMLRRNWNWGNAMLLFARHPDLRRERLLLRVFWNWSHWLVGRLWLAAVLPWRRSAWPVKLWLAAPYVRHRLPHPRSRRPSLASLLWFLLADTVEMVGTIRGALRFRTFVL